MADIFCSEVLFFVNNNFGMIPENNLITVLCSFYDENELCTAKSVLHTVATQLLPEDPNVPRLKTRLAGDNKRRLDAEDILGLFTCLDIKKVTMPVFAAVNSSRLPSVNPSDADICSLSATIADIRDQFSEMLHSVKSLVESNILNQVADLTATVNHRRAQLAEVVSSSQSQQVQSVQSGVMINEVIPVNKHHDHHTDAVPLNWASIVAQLNNNTEWKNTISKKERRLIRGTARKEAFTLTSSIDTNIENKEKVWQVFASRLHKDTTADDVTDFLNDSSITVVKCEKLEPKEEWQRKSAAFHIQVDIKCKDSVFY